MRILWFTWKDLKHPQAGGAEIVNEELAKRLVLDGHEVIFITSGFKNAKPEETINGYKVIRLGNRYSVYWHAYNYYKKNLQGWADLAIDEVNTIPFFAKFYVKEPNILFVHQLARKIWFYQMPFPLSLIGYLAEPLYLRLLANKKVITISKSTKSDLLRFRFKEENVSILTIGIDSIYSKKQNNFTKFPKQTLISLGAVRPMKRTLDQIKAFEIAKKEIPELELKVAGDHSSSYGIKVFKYIKKSKFKDDIELLGRVSTTKKIILLQKSHIIIVTSVKEGWGLIVTEANSQRTPAVVYNVDGLRDSVIHNKTGVTTSATPESLAKQVVSLLKNEHKYDKMSNLAYEWSKTINFDKSYQDFNEVLIKITGSLS